LNNTKLIFVEGLPGLGKTTAASWLAARLTSEGLKVNLYLETQPEHPLNVGGDLHPAGDVSGDLLFKDYTSASYIQESLERWQAFVGAALHTEAISVLDSFPFQNTVRVLLQLNTSPDRLRNYTNQIENLATPLQPMLIYFNLRDIPSTIDHFTQICEQRGQAWVDYVIELVTHCPYGESRHLEGFNGLLTFIIDYKQLIDSLLSESRIPRLVLENCTKNYGGCYRQVETFLGLA
jgi:hypothetical protein